MTSSGPLVERLEIKMVVRVSHRPIELSKTPSGRIQASNYSFDNQSVHLESLEGHFSSGGLKFRKLLQLSAQPTRARKIFLFWEEGVTRLQSRSCINISILVLLVEHQVQPDNRIWVGVSKFPCLSYQTHGEPTKYCPKRQLYQEEMSEMVF